VHTLVWDVTINTSAISWPELLGHNRNRVKKFHSHYCKRYAISEIYNIIIHILLYRIILYYNIVREHDVVSETSADTIFAEDYGGIICVAPA